MMSLPKQWQNSDLRETKQIIHRSKGTDKSCPKLYFSLNLSHCVKKLWPILSNFGSLYHRVAIDLENLEKSGNLKETSESHEFA